jgi:hypothetical protein
MVKRRVFNVICPKSGLRVCPHFHPQVRSIFFETYLDDFAFEWEFDTCQRGVTANAEGSVCGEKGSLKRC